MGKSIGTYVMIEIEGHQQYARVSGLLLHIGSGVAYFNETPMQVPVIVIMTKTEIKEIKMEEEHLRITSTLITKEEFDGKPA